MEKTVVEFIKQRVEEDSDTSFFNIDWDKFDEIIEQAKEMYDQEKGFSEDDVNLAFFLGKKDDHLRLHKLINSRLGQIKSE